MTVEISGLSLFTHHGVTDAEQQTGQRMVFDVSFDVEDCDATVTDRLEDTIDYAAVCQAVALVATERSYRTLERVCTAVADMLEERFSASGIDGARGQARAADPAAGRGGLGRGLPLSRTGYLGLGSNVGDRLANLRAAVALLDAQPDDRGRRALVGLRDRAGRRGHRPARLLNAASRRDDARAAELLDACKEVERELGREPGGRAPRPAADRRRPAAAGRRRASTSSA